MRSRPKLKPLKPRLLRAKRNQATPSDRKVLRAALTQLIISLHPGDIVGACSHPKARAKLREVREWAVMVGGFALFGLDDCTGAVRMMCDISDRLRAQGEVMP